MSELTVELHRLKRSKNKIVDLSKRSLAFIPKQIYAVNIIQELHLADNNISSIDPDISQLFRLKTLNLQNNSIRDLPEQITQLPMLSTLNLKNNPLSKQFQILLQTYQGNLIETLQSCFESKGNSNAMTRTKKNSTSTPSWLIQNQQKKQQKWQPGYGSPQKVDRNRTAYGRRLKPQGKQQFQPQREFINGVLVLKTQDLNIGEQISMGGFSTIHRGKYLSMEVAIKKVFNPNITEEILSQFNNQVNMLARYRHPNIVLLIGAITTPPHLCLAMQYVKDGTLFDLVNRKKVQLSDQDKKKIAEQIVSVIVYLHQHGIVHRDIKSHNILLDRNYVVKLCDFGLARHKSQLNSGPMQFSGTPIYMAQELFNKRAYNQSVDIFALGTLLYELYSGEVPYYGLDPSDIRDKLMKDHNLPMKISIRKTILQIINRCRTPVPEERPSAQDLISFNDW